MSAARFTIESGAVEVAARFETEGEIDAFFDDLWRIWFVTHPAPDDAGSPLAPANFCAGTLSDDLPAFLKRRRDAVIEESDAQRPGVDARDKRGHDGGEKAAAHGPNIAVMAGLDPANHESNARQPDVDARRRAGHDAGLEEAAPVGTADQTAAFAALTPTQRRVVLLKRKLGKTASVAAEMGVSERAVNQHLSAARDKGVAI